MPTVWACIGRNNDIVWMFVSDVISIEKTSENFRLVYDVKGRFAVHRITPDEASVSYGLSLDEQYTC